MSTAQLMTLGAAAVGAALALLASYVRRRQQESLPPPWRPRPEDLVATGASERVAAQVVEGHMIEAIKAYRDERGVGLREAKTALEGLVRRATSRARTSQLMAAGASEQVARLLAAGTTIEAIKAYRQETGAGLREAKIAVDRLRLSS